MINKKQFSEDFVWGVSTSAFQIEGAWLEDGKGLSVWDVFSHTPGKILNDDRAETACDHYRRIKEDVALLKDLGVSAYRFSVSWPRILPQGYGKINQKGIDHYSALIDLLLKNNIEPWLTLHHWDMPSTLFLEKDGWLNPEMADYFADYARVCFEAFGGKVRNWITLNEPWVTAILGYGSGQFAPGRKSDTEPYIAAHTMLRAHGKAARIFRREYKSKLNGQIGMANNCDWREPKTDTPADREAAQRALEFFLGWFADPLYKGDYPQSMKERIGARLPQFTQEDIELIKGSCDYFGLNHYTTMYASQAAPTAQIHNDSFSNGGLPEDERVLLSSDPSWPKTNMGWGVVPWGLSKLLHWIDKRYDSPDIYITENGASFTDKPNNEGIIDDPRRIEYLQQYIQETAGAREQGVSVKGYFVWSLMDNYEWALGYSQRFGLYYVDYQTLERIPKESAKWYMDFLKK
jgi:beta-glucosidase